MDLKGKDFFTKNKFFPLLKECFKQAFKNYLIKQKRYELLFCLVCFYQI